jgi:hypothetical protein
MSPTLEVRWFFDQLQTPLEEWFANKGLHFQKNKPYPRIDFYLLISAEKGLGIKLREGNIEIKEPIDISDSENFEVHGRVESWQRWGFKVEKIDNLADEIIDKKKDGWIEIPKERIGFKYRFDDANNIIMVPIDDKTLKEGCQIEYTRFEMNGKEYYTFNLESFSKSNKQKENFKKGVELALKDLETWDISQARALPLKPKLSKENSMGYPEFFKKYSSTDFAILA